MTEKHVGVGTAVIILDGNKVLLGHRLDARKNKLCNDTWCLPGGMMEFGETPEQTCIRETKEECNLDVGEIEVVCIDNNTFYGNHNITIGAVAKKWSGEVKNMEPHKCAGWKWFDLNAPPENIYIPSERVIEKFKTGRFW